MNNNECSVDKLAAQWQEVVTAAVTWHMPEVAVAFSRRANEGYYYDRLILDLTFGGATACYFIELRDGGFSVDDVCDRLAARLDELKAQHEKLGARILSARTRAQEAVQRAGGDMKLISLGMAPAPIQDTLDWHGTRLEAEIEILDNELKPEVVRVLAFSGRRFAGNIRLYGVAQRRRHRQLARLRERGAVLEIDAMAEALIIEHGHDVGEIGRRLLDGEPAVELVTGDGPEVAIGLTARIAEGQLQVDGNPSAAKPDAFLWGRSFRLNGHHAEQASALIGKSPASLINFPAMPQSVRVSRVSERNGPYTDIDVKVSRRFITKAELRHDDRASPPCAASTLTGGQALAA